LSKAFILIPVEPRGTNVLREPKILMEVPYRLRVPGGHNMWLLRELLFYLKPAFKALKQATVPILIFMLSALIAHDAAQMSRSAYCRPPIPGDDRDVSGLSTLVNRKSKPLDGPPTILICWD
jgi:hypothetical protein